MHDDCKNSLNSKYEYKGKCFFNCPIKASPSFYNKYLFQDIWPNNYKFRSIEDNECMGNCSTNDFLIKNA